MAKYVDLSERVSATFYSDEYEEWTQQTVTIADVLDSVCDDYTVLPSAQPDLNEWCTDCKEYDKEKHYCPRFNRVIREALKDAQPERKTGKWNFIGDNMFECTSCGVVYTTNQLNSLRNYDTDPYAPKFCPNCGSDNRIKHTDASPYDSHDPIPELYKERKNETDNSNQTD